MAIPSRKTFARTVYIICEDSKTGPSYLAFLRKDVIGNSLWDEIKIYPEPIIGPLNESSGPNEHKKQQKRRSFQPSAIDVEPEEEYSEQPVRYVRSAQKAIADAGYDVAWAVFDLDGHTGHQRAAKLAEQDIDGKKVQIAFSSRSIEQWFLLHFHQSNQIFKKTNCKDNNGRELSCDHNNNCPEDECLVGYIRRNTTLNGYAKKMSESLNAELRERMHLAFQNAEWLRHHYDETTPYFERNPYTTMDQLVKQLFRVVIAGDEVSIGAFQWKIFKVNQTIVCRVKNIGNQRVIINRNIFGFFDSSNQEIDFEIENGGILAPDESIEVRIFLPNLDTTGFFLKFPNNDQSFTLYL